MEKNLKVKEIQPNFDPDINWHRLVVDGAQVFQFGEDPELIYVIETGFKDRWMVVFEDAYELMLGKVKFYSKKELEDTFKIKVFSRFEESDPSVVEREISILKKRLAKLEDSLTSE